MSARGQRHLPALALALCTLSGCTLFRESSGGALDTSQLEALAQAENKEQVLERVGPPMDVGLQLEGGVFIYRFREEALDNLNLSLFRATFDYETIERRTDRLAVFFDKQGRVLRYGLDLATRADDEDEDEDE